MEAHQLLTSWLLLLMRVVDGMFVFRGRFSVQKLLGCRTWLSRALTTRGLCLTAYIYILAAIDLISSHIDQSIVTTLIRFVRLRFRSTSRVAVIIFVVRFLVLFSHEYVAHLFLVQAHALRCIFLQEYKIISSINVRRIDSWYVATFSET